MIFEPNSFEQTSWHKVKLAIWEARQMKLGRCHQSKQVRKSTCAEANGWQCRVTGSRRDYVTAGTVKLR
jgi:hypothetical protein